MNEKLEKIKKLGQKSIWKSLLLNLIFLLVFLIIFNPDYEVRDDNMMKEIAAGARGTYNSYLVFINIIIGKILTTLYTIIPGVEWYSIVQTGIIFFAFVILAWMVYVRWGTSWGTGINCAILGFFGYECYVGMQFTKTAGLCTLTGGLLIYYTFEASKKKWLLLPGVLYMFTGSLYRFGMFEMTMIGTMPIYAYWLIRGGKADIRKNLRLVGMNAIVYAVALLLAVGAKQMNSRMYENDPQWRYFWEYNTARCSLMDYEFLDYEEYESTYQRLGISKEDYEYYSAGFIADPEKFSLDTMKQLITSKKAKKLDGVFLIEFFKTFPLAFLAIKVFGALLLVVIFSVLWDKKSLILIAMQTLTMLGVYAYLYYQGRVLINRVDATFVLAQCMILLLSYNVAEKESWKKVKMLPIVLASLLMVLACRGNDYYWNIANATEESRQDKQERQEILELIWEDKEHLYLTHREDTEKAWGLYDKIPFGGLSNVYRLHGWQLGLPENENVLNTYCITNPYRESINNGSVYWPEKSRPKQLLSYIQRNYDGNARLIKLKEINGMGMYAITSGELILDENEMHEPDVSIVSKVEAYVEGERLYIKGKLYKKNTDSYKQRAYLKVVDDAGRSSYQYVTLYKDEKEPDKQQGRYAAIDGNFRYKKWNENYRAFLILETDGGRYEVPLQVDIK